MWYEIFFKDPGGVRNTFIIVKRGYETNFDCSQIKKLMLFNKYKDSVHGPNDVFIDHYYHCRKRFNHL